MTEAKNKEKTIKSYFSFRVKNPITHFAEIFQKEVPQ